MLLKSRISPVEMHSEQWHSERCSRFTSSDNYNLMGEKPFTQGAISYIYRKVGEALTGVPARDTIETSATVHGNVYEPEALRKYKAKMGIEFLVTQKLIYGESERFSSTPDAIEILSERSDCEGYNVKPIEVKCPPTYDAYIGLCMCNTPFDLKREERRYYWQLIDQVDTCGALTGTFLVYHPDFSQGSMKIIEFRIMEKVGNEYPLKKDLDLLRERKQMAVEKFNEIKGKMLAL
jgi:hypothetical protein